MRLRGQAGTNSLVEPRANNVCSGFSAPIVAPAAPRRYLATRSTIILVLLSHIIGALPRAWALALGRLFGLLWYYAVPVRRRVARRNVARALGGSLSKRAQRRLVRRSFVHLAQYGVELLRIPQMTATNVDAWTTLEGSEHLDAGLRRGKGIILVASHVGHVDLAGTSMAVRGYPITVVAKDLGRFTRSFVTKVRERTGVVILPPRRSGERIKELVAQNKIVVLIVDQHVARHRAIVCDFFGQLAATTPAPARFGFETGATLLRGVAYRRPDGSHVTRIEGSFELETPFETHADNLRHNTERINGWVEGWIREFPEQWHWVHKRWKVQEDPEGWEIPDKLRPLLRH